jgi:hypothetical protein
MRILFVMRNHGYLRNYGSIIQLLASRAHSTSFVVRASISYNPL